MLDEDWKDILLNAAMVFEKASLMQALVKNQERLTIKTEISDKIKL